MTTDNTSIGADVPFLKVTRTVNRPIKDVYEHMIEADLPRIFPRTSETPGLVSTTVPKGWSVGQERVNTYDNGTTNRETLLVREPYHLFSYRIDNFTSPVQKQLLDHLEGRWFFTDNGNSTTNVEMTYFLVPANPEVKKDVEQKLVKFYQNRLDMGLSIIKNDLEG